MEKKSGGSGQRGGGQGGYMCSGGGVRVDTCVERIDVFVKMQK